MSGNPVGELYTNIDPSEGRIDVIDAGALLDHLTKWGPKNGFGTLDNYDHVMYWAGWVADVTLIC